MTGLAEARAIRANLQTQLAENEGVIAGIGDRRRQHAYGASQGDPKAKAALELVIADERAAKEAVENLTLAIAEASRNLDDASGREKAAHEKQQAAKLSSMSCELIELDKEIVSSIVALRDLLDSRGEKITDILEMRLLAPACISRLSSDEPVAEALGAGLWTYLGRLTNGRHTSHANALESFLATDCQALGKPELASAVQLTAPEKEMARVLFKRPSPHPPGVPR